MDFPISKALDGEVTIIEIPKRLSADISDNFRDFLYSLVEKGNHKLVIDLSKTEYVDSSGLGAIVSRIAVCRSNKGDIRLASPKAFMDYQLKITHLDRVLKTYKDMNAAVDSFKAVL
jgi:anti-sigma B factor antagonist